MCVARGGPYPFRGTGCHNTITCGCLSSVSCARPGTSTTLQRLAHILPGCCPGGRQRRRSGRLAGVHALRPRTVIHAAVIHAAMDEPAEAAESLRSLQIAPPGLEMPNDISNKANEIDPNIYQRAFSLTRQAYRLGSLTYKDPPAIGAPEGGNAAQTGAARVAAVGRSSTFKRRKKTAGVFAAGASPGPAAASFVPPPSSADTARNPSSGGRASARALGVAMQ